MTLRTIKKRRRECKTDYKLRLGLLKSSLPRIVIRKTNKYIGIQIVESEEAQDKVTFGTTSKALLDYGWDEKLAGSLKSTSAAYLTGFLVAKKVKTGEFIIDIGMALNQKGGRIYAVIAGLMDGGLNIHANKEVLPSKERLMGEHQSEAVQAIIRKVMEKIDSGKSETKTEKKVKVEDKKIEAKEKIVKVKKEIKK